MASSRIFVKGLPPTFSDADFRKHFSQNGRAITDAKIFPNRRIGFVGYKTTEDAQKAVKYFNKSFIRMSRIGVELARPPVEEVKTANLKGKAPTAQRDEPAADTDGRLKRKRNGEDHEEKDPKLAEFLDVMRPKNKKKAWEMDNVGELDDVPGLGKDEVIPIPAKDGESDGEYENMTKTKKLKSEIVNNFRDATEDIPTDTDGLHSIPEPQEAQAVVANATVSDADWARSRTSRLLGLLDDEEEGKFLANDGHLTSDDELDVRRVTEGRPATEEESILPQSISAAVSSEEKASDVPADADLVAVRESMRLFIRNLPYDVQRDDLEAEFASFGNLEEVHVPLDKKTGLGKGFAYIQYSDPDSAEQAFVDRDGQTFQGRLLHVLPAATRRDGKLDDYALSKLPLKKQQEIKRRREAASSTFNWNALYMNADAVVASIADRLGLSKSEVLDPTNSDAAIKQAHAETHVIQETKSYFRQQGVDLESFKRSQRGDTAILVKNVPFDCSKDELKRLFEEQGDVKRFLMPPSGLIAMVEFANAAQCKVAFAALAYRKLKNSVLFLEKAPKDVFSAVPVAESGDQSANGITKIVPSDLKDGGKSAPDTTGRATLFVRNLNFSTTTQHLTETFKPLEGFLSAIVKTKTDAKRPGETLSMGFGFVEFRSAKQAQTALQVMDGYTLAGHKLQIRSSHKGADAAEERKKADAERRAAGQGTKIIIKNLPFQASKQDVRALFGEYGQLRSVRVPKKIDHAARGFAFADFTTAKEAQNAMESLRNTHILGRRLVLDFATEDAEDAEAEIEKMQQKVGAQANKVALQKLTSGGRKKFTTQNDDDQG